MSHGLHSRRYIPVRHRGLDVCRVVSRTSGGSVVRGASAGRGCDGAPVGPAAGWLPHDSVVVVAARQPAGLPWSGVGRFGSPPELIAGLVARRPNESPAESAASGALHEEGSARSVRRPSAEHVAELIAQLVASTPEIPPEEIVVIVRRAAERPSMPSRNLAAAARHDVALWVENRRVMLDRVAARLLDSPSQIADVQRRLALEMLAGRGLCVSLGEGGYPWVVYERIDAVAGSPLEVSSARDRRDLLSHLRAVCPALPESWYERATGYVVAGPTIESRRSRCGPAVQKGRMLRQWGDSIAAWLVTTYPVLSAEDRARLVELAVADRMSDSIHTAKVSRLSARWRYRVVRLGRQHGLLTDRVGDLLVRLLSRPQIPEWSHGLCRVILGQAILKWPDRADTTVINTVYQVISRLLEALDSLDHIIEDVCAAGSPEQRAAIRARVLERLATEEPTMLLRPRECPYWRDRLGLLVREAVAVAPTRPPVEATQPLLVRRLAAEFAEFSPAMLGRVIANVTATGISQRRPATIGFQAANRCRDLRDRFARFEEVLTEVQPGMIMTPEWRAQVWIAALEAQRADLTQKQVRLGDLFRAMATLLGTTGEAHAALVRRCYAVAARLKLMREFPGVSPRAVAEIVKRLERTRLGIRDFYGFARKECARKGLIE